MFWWCAIGHAPDSTTVIDLALACTTQQLKRYILYWNTNILYYIDINTYYVNIWIYVCLTHTSSRRFAVPCHLQYICNLRVKHWGVCNDSHRPGRRGAPYLPSRAPWQHAKQICSHLKWSRHHGLSRDWHLAVLRWIAFRSHRAKGDQIISPGTWVPLEWFQGATSDLYQVSARKYNKTVVQSEPEGGSAFQSLFKHSLRFCTMSLLSTLSQFPMTELRWT